MTTGRQGRQGKIPLGTPLEDLLGQVKFPVPKDFFEWLLGQPGFQDYVKGIKDPEEQMAAVKEMFNAQTQELRSSLHMAHTAAYSKYISPVETYQPPELNLPVAGLPTVVAGRPAEWTYYGATLDDTGR